MNIVGGFRVLPIDYPPFAALVVPRGIEMSAEPASIRLGIPIRLDLSVAYVLWDVAQDSAERTQPIQRKTPSPRDRSAWQLFAR